MAVEQGDPVVCFRIPLGGHDGLIRVLVDGRAGDRMSVEVQSEGAIAAGLLPHVFDPFRRGDGSGEGLGLFIVREIARAHGGEVGVVSGPGIGTSFELVLPRHRPNG